MGESVLSFPFQGSSRTVEVPLQVRINRTATAPAVAPMLSPAMNRGSGTNWESSIFPDMLDCAAYAIAALASAAAAAVSQNRTIGLSPR